jgi:hypothetical protein
MKLLFSKDLVIKTKYNIILIIIDKLTKFEYITLFREIYIIEELVYIFL